MGILKINQLKNQFVKDIATQCDIVKPDGQLEGQELSIFKERTEQAIKCKLLKKEDLAKDLQQILGIELVPEKAKSANAMGYNIADMLGGYTNQSEYFTVTHYVKNLNSYTKDFLNGYKGRWELDICEQIATEWFYNEKEEVIKTLCKKVPEDAERFGDKNSAEYNTVKDISENKDIVDIAKSGALDKCMLELIRTFKTDNDPSSLIDRIQNK